MGLNDVTREGVLAAMGEFDRMGREAFLAKHGFRAAREYFLTRDGRRYDSKAIVGAAHGMAGGPAPLPASAFSGGDATVAALLQRLGFEVVRSEASEVRVRRNPTWAPEELI